MESLSGRAALVTGAGRGIGAAIARSHDAAFVLTRPRGQRILEVAMRPVTETSWG